MASNYSLPLLPYPYDALQPCISKEIMQLHHSKHHQTYVNNLNAALQKQQTAATNQELVQHLYLQDVIRFNAGGHINHTLFWQNLTPPSSAEANTSRNTRLIAAIEQRWGSLERFKAAFEALLLSITGSGWGWLVQHEEGGYLEIVKTKDQEIVPAGNKPLLGVDMWEHAYYLQYLNDKKTYVTKVWDVVNWQVVENRLLSSSAEVYGQLAGLKASI